MKAAVIILTLLCLPLTAQAESTDRIEVHCSLGQLTVTSVETDGVQAPGMKQTRHGDVLRLTATQCPPEIKLPAVDVRITVQSGAVNVNGKFPSIEVQTAAGPVRVNAKANDIEVRTLSGAIEIEGQAESVRAEAVSGKIGISVSNAQRVRAQTTNGKIEIAAASLARYLEAQTVNGKIVLQGELQKNADIRAKSMSGAIDAMFSSESEYRLQTSTFSGRVTKTDQPKQPAGTDAARVRFQTFSGSIRLK